MPPGDVAPQPAVLEMKGISKSFPGVQANRKVDFSVRAGEVHALVGENGAGKTTLMRILYGMYQPDEGTITLFGRPQRIPNPAAAIALGVGMVHQHFMLVPSLTVAENMVLGVEPVRGVFLDRRRAVAEVRRISAEYGLKVDPDVAVRDCPVGVQQRVEILKALYRGARLLILDEPTAVLTPQEAAELFTVLRGLAAQGKSVIFISHKLKEVLTVSDRITVMRHGRVVGVRDTAATSERELASMMVGRDVLLRVQKKPARPGPEVLRVEDLHVSDDRGLPAVRGVSFAVRAGEIVGIAGVEGNGQSELVEALTGLRPVDAGTVTLEGRRVPPGNPRAARELGMAHVPEDRFRRGLSAGSTIAENLIAGRHAAAPLARAGVLHTGRIRRLAEDLIRRFDIRAPGPDTLAGNLSGGNAQKVVVAREFTSGVRCLVASQPTRGVDIGSVEFIHQQIVALRDQGCAVLLISADLHEVMSLSDRILVMYEGRFTGEVEATGATEEQLGLLMLGGGSGGGPGPERRVVP